MTSKKIFKISGGPSKFDLMVSLFDGDSSNRRSVSFTVEEQTCEVTISTLSREDGSGESWNFSGFVRGSIVSPGYGIKGYYSSQRRCGHFEVINP